jgi:hypothetical protein
MAMGGLAVRLSKVTERQRYSGWRVLDLWGRQDGIRWNSERRVSDVVVERNTRIARRFHRSTIEQSRRNVPTRCPGG